MENREAIEVLQRSVLTVCDYDLHEAVDTAISALEQQEADKCCETCKHKDRLVSEWRCSECFRASNLEDYWEPYTEEEP